MSFQPAGLVLAFLTFAAIGAGHILVRRLHARYGTRPALPLFCAGGLILAASLISRPDLLSAALGITGITIVWDGVEMFRQERRVRH